MCKALRVALPVVLAGVCALALGTGSALANCDIGIPIFAGGDGAPISVATCSSNPSGAFWLIGHGDSAIGAGVDSGVRGMRFDIASFGGVLSADWNDLGVDGCPLNFLQPDGTFAPNAMVISGQLNGGTPSHVGSYSALSVDYYEPFQSGYSYDEVFGDELNGTIPPGSQISCAALGAPAIAGGNLSWGGVSSLDDCATNTGSIHAASDCFGGTRPIFQGWHLYVAYAQCTVGPLSGDRTAPGAWNLVTNAFPNNVYPAASNAGVSLASIPLSIPANECAFLAYNPVWESGMEGRYVSAHSAKQGGTDNTDGDTIPSSTDNCPTVSNQTQADADGDGLGDACDNCDFAVNYDQADSNGNGVGDACDSCPTSGDTDGDGVCDDVDNCPALANTSQTDSDGDGLGDACDPCPFDTGSGNDSDGDGICNATDNCPNVANPTQLDTDSDGLGDPCDPCPFEAPAPGQVGFNDKDGDGICSCDPVLQNAGKCGVFPNITEGHGTPADNCPRTPNVSQTPSGLGDGLGLACEDKFAAVQVRPTNDQGFGDCRIRFKTVEEWNCPRFQAVYRSPGGDRNAGVSLSCRRCTTGEGFSSAFYGGTAGAYIKFCHGGHDIYAQAVRTVTSASCPGFVNPNPVAAVRVEKVATRVR